MVKFAKRPFCIRHWSSSCGLLTQRRRSTCTLCTLAATNTNSRCSVSPRSCNSSSMNASRWKQNLRTTVSSNWEHCAPVVRLLFSLVPTMGARRKFQTGTKTSSLLPPFRRFLVLCILSHFFCSISSPFSVKKRFTFCVQFELCKKHVYTVFREKYAPDRKGGGGRNSTATVQ